MNLKNSESYTKVIEYLLLATLIGVPLYYDTNIYLTFDLSKALLVRLLTLCILFVGLAKLILLPPSFKRSPLDRPVLAFLGITILSTLFSVSPWVSFLGTYRRFEGLTTFLCYIVLFYSVVNFINPNRVNRFFKCVVVVGLISALYGLYQWLGGEAGKWQAGVIPISTYGNQNFLAAYLVMAIPLSLTLYLAEDKKKKSRPNIFWAVSFLILTLALLLTKTRGGWVGFGLSLPIFFLLAGKHVLKRKEVKTGGVIALIAFIILCINPSTSPLSRLMGTFEKKEKGVAIAGSALERLYIWQAGIRTTLAYPLFGCGIETMRLAYPKYEPKELEVVGGHNVKADRSHNETIDMGVTRGITGLLIYFWFWFAICVMILKIRKKDGLVAGGLGAGFLAYFLQNQFNFSMVSYTTTFWVLLGLAALLGIKEEKGKTQKISISNARWAILSITSVFIILGLVSIIPIYIADTHFKKAIGAKESGQFDNAILWSEKAISYHPKEVYYYETLCESLFMKAQGSSGEKQRQWADKCFDAAHKALAITPTNGFFYNLLGGLHTLLYLSGDEKEGEIAIKDYKYALKLMPIFTEAYMNLAVIYKKQERMDEAIDCYKKIIDINPDHTFSLISLGDIYLSLKRPPEALKEYEKASTSAKIEMERYSEEKEKFSSMKSYADSMISGLKR
ncbi:O-antigen ligase family protein [bacterium]|nr:O-antigen ligase family protein [bacterium]